MRKGDGETGHQQVARIKSAPLLYEQLRTCPINQLPMYAELVATVVTGGQAKATTTHLEGRLVHVMQPAKRKRIEKVLKKLARDLTRCGAQRAGGRVNRSHLDAYSLGRRPRASTFAPTRNSLRTRPFSP
jgi:hypothetical protein